MQIKREVRNLLFQNIFIPIVLGVVSCLALALVTWKLRNANELVSHTDEVIRTISVLGQTISDSQAALRGQVLGAPGGSSPDFLTSFYEAHAQASSTLLKLTALVQDNQLQSQRVREVNDLLLNWFATAKSISQKSRQSTSAAQGRVAGGEGEFLTRELRRRLQELAAEEYRLRQERIEEQQGVAGLSLAFLIPLLLFGNGFIAYRGRRSIFFVSDSYAAQLDENQKQMKILERENWIQETESLLATTLTTTATLRAMGQEYLRFAGEKFNALAGLVYVRNPSQVGEFQQIAALGLDPGRNHRSTITPQNTLHHKAITSLEPQVMGDMGGSRWVLETGLATREAQYLMLIPISLTGRCVVLVELAFLNAPGERMIEFCRQSSERLGGLFANEIAKEDLAQLNTELKSKSEELRVQQEELRSVNEKLENRAELLRESQRKLEENNSELEEANELLQRQTVDLEEQKRNLDERNQELLNTRNLLQAQAKELERASQYKSQFLANISHELRTPLNSAMILAQVLMENKDGNLTDKQVQSAAQILRSGRDLLALINDILDLSKVESGHIELEVERVPMASLVAWAKGSFETSCAQKGLQLLLPEVGPEDWIETDRLRLQQVLGNLLSNAIKFTSEGEVRLRIRSLVSGEGEGEGPVVFDVEDTGIGIQADRLDVIFQPFKQADETITRRFGGTGLGLTISKNLTLLLGGRLTVNSQEGQGTKFRLELPRRIRSAPIRLQTVSPAPRPTVSDQRFELPKAVFDEKRDANIVLLIEDDLAFARILKEHIQERGFECRHATTAADGLQFATELAHHGQTMGGGGGSLLKAIVLDVHLPDGSGLTVLEKLKADSRTHAIPVHIVSVHEDTTRAMQLGAAQYLKKPLSLEGVRTLLDVLGSDISDSPKRVLVIDDDQSQITALRHLLESDSVQVDATLTGTEGLQKLLDGESYDCVILDLRLPDTSGFDLLRQLTSSRPSAVLPPILVHTSLELTRAEEAELRTMAKSLILKGASSYDRILDEVSFFLRQTFRRDQTSSRGASGPAVLEGQKVLLVDDDLRNVFALTSALESKGASVWMARNGKEAIETLKKDPAFDVVLMDVMMPVMDGFEAMRLIRRELALKDLPIIALTAKAMKNDREACIEAGANDYLAKPIDIQKLFSLIRIWTSQLV